MEQLVQPVFRLLLGANSALQPQLAYLAKVDIIHSTIVVYLVHP